MVKIIAKLDYISLIALVLGTIFFLWSIALQKQVISMDDVKNFLSKDNTVIADPNYEKKTAPPAGPTYSLVESSICFE